VLIVTFVIEAFAPRVTLLVPVVEMMTLSPATGAIPPTQVVPAVQTPPRVVLVLVAAFILMKELRKKRNPKKNLVFLFL
jgi:hypothetical protein